MSTCILICTGTVYIQALVPLGIGVATGEMCQNRVMFKQFLKAKAMQYCQIDACRLGGVNEVLAVILLAAKYNGWLLINILFFFLNIFLKLAQVMVAFRIVETRQETRIVIYL